MRRIFSLCIFLMLSALSLSAQESEYKVKFFGANYQYKEGADSIQLYLKVVDRNEEKPSLADVKNCLHIEEDGNSNNELQHILIPQQGLPKDLTFSLLIDQSIEDGKEEIFKIVKQLVETAPDSCVYISFFGDEVSESKLVTSKNIEDFKSSFEESASRKLFYSALYYKLKEIGGDEDRPINQIIKRRAAQNPNKNILIVLTDSRVEPDIDDEFRYDDVTGYQKDTNHVGPKVFALYYDSGNGFNEMVKLTLEGVSGGDEDIPQERKGDCFESDDLDKILDKFQSTLDDQKYDYVFIYKATDGKTYTGPVNYSAFWGGTKVGEATYSIGSPENPWPLRKSSYETYFIALLVTFLTIAFFFIIMKIVIPFIKSKSFSMKYYKKYVPEANVQKRICHYCKQAIIPGQMVVTKCAHVMHVHCWQQNDYRCSEYGQNCKTGSQEHVDWPNLLSWSSIKDCQLTIAGIIAGLVSWVVYELMGRGGFTSTSTWIVNNFLDESLKKELSSACITKISAFIITGMLLGFFLSLIFRYNDEYRKKDANVYLKIIGLSLLTAVISMASFAFGGIILCMMLSDTYIPWYCSLPAYLLFSVCTSLSLTIKSSIPVKSAMIGGLVSSVIGFLVLYFSKFLNAQYGMLLDFIIYGGGLGASLVTVRMLAEKYFLVIMNGEKAGLRIPIHKWMNATGGGNKVTIGMTGECEIQMNWDKSNRVAKEHNVLFIDHARSMPMMKPLAPGVLYNNRAELPVGKPSALSNGDQFKIGDTMFQYVETE